MAACVEVMRLAMGRMDMAAGESPDEVAGEGAADSWDTGMDEVSVDMGYSGFGPPTGRARSDGHERASGTFAVETRVVVGRSGRPGRNLGRPPGGVTAGRS